MSEVQQRETCSGRFADGALAGRRIPVGLLAFVVFVVSIALVGLGLAPSLSIAKDGEPAVDGAAAGVRQSMPERPAEAVAAISRLRKELGAALRGGLAKGPIEAISACRLDAPRITHAIGKGATVVGRTSHRLRNPDNAPEDWMRPLLNEYLKSQPSPGSFRTVDLGARGIATVEPIYLKPLCATCHGENVAPDLLTSIREQYPEDEAVGFRVGEFRGLFWSVTKVGSIQ